MIKSWYYTWDLVTCEEEEETMTMMNDDDDDDDVLGELTYNYASIKGNPGYIFPPLQYWSFQQYCSINVVLIHLVLYTLRMIIRELGELVQTCQHPKDKKCDSEPRAGKCSEKWVKCYEMSWIFSLKDFQWRLWVFEVTISL